MTIFSKSVSFTKLDILALAVVAVVFAPLVWWAADRTPPIILTTYDVEPDNVPPGGTIYRVIGLTRLRQCEVTPQTILVDGGRVRWYFDDRPVSIPGPVGTDHYKRPIVIPMQALPGKAVLRTTTEFVCNPVHLVWPIKTTNPPLEFTITRQD